MGLGWDRDRLRFKKGGKGGGESVQEGGSPVGHIQLIPHAHQSNLSSRMQPPSLGCRRYL